MIRRGIDFGIIGYMINKKVLDNFLEHGFISKPDYERALSVLPRENPKDWALRRLLGVGSGLFLAGIVCFFAYNWKEIGVSLRLGLPLLGMFLCALGGWKFRPESPVGAAFCVATGVFAGTFMAGYGQEFQTGAFVYELFSSWTIILAVLALISQVRWLWLMAFYAFAVYLETKYSLAAEFYGMVGCGLAAWAVCEMMIYKKVWPASFRNWFFIPFFAYLSIHSFLLFEAYNTIKFWVMPLLALLGIVLSLKMLKSASLLCTSVFVLTIFLNVELFKKMTFDHILSYGYASAFIFAWAGLAAWRGVQYIRGKK